MTKSQSLAPGAATASPPEQAAWHRPVVIHAMRHISAGELTQAVLTFIQSDASRPYLTDTGAMDELAELSPDTVAAYEAGLMVWPVYQAQRQNAAEQATSFQITLLPTGCVKLSDGGLSRLCSPHELCYGHQRLLIEFIEARTH